MVINRQLKVLMHLKLVKIQKLNVKTKNPKTKKINERKKEKRDQKLQLMMLIKNQMCQRTKNDHVCILYFGDIHN